jgi:hypothetical protein
MRLAPSGARLNHRTKVTFNRLDFDQDDHFLRTPSGSIRREIAGLVERVSYQQYQQFHGHTTGFASLGAFESSDHQMAVSRTGSNQPAQPWYAEIRFRKFLCNPRPSPLRWAAVAALRRYAGRGSRKS